MTLVVAYAGADICFMVGDTLLSHEHFALKGDLGPVNGEFHSLKIQILTGELAIGFAGNFDVAYSAVAALKFALSVDPTLDPTEWIASRSITDADFLVLKNGVRKELFVIESANVRQARRSAGCGPARSLWGSGASFFLSVAGRRASLARRQPLRLL
jgi:hypothetical protein